MVPHGFFLLRAFLHGLHGHLHSLAQAYDARHVLRAGAALSLLRTAMDKGSDFYALADVEKSDSLGAVQLVPAGAEHVDVHFLHIQRNLAKGLDCVCMEEDVMLLRHGPNLRNGHNGPNLIVCRHDGDEDGVWLNGRLHCLWRHPSVFVYV